MEGGGGAISEREVRNMQRENRRSFLKKASGMAAAPALRLSAYSPNEKFVVACMGCRGRARGLLYGFAELPEVEVSTICDVDSRLFAEAVKGVAARQRKEPRTVTDFRRILDDRSIDILVIGTPTHWHAIPSILACQAGKHVYVEKPAGHNIRESRRMLEAARRHKRVMQVVIQSRSGRNLEEACAYIRSGQLGKVMYAKAWESAHQRSIGRPPDGPVPPGVDYDMWLGPAPKRPFNPNRFHGNWRWFFDYCGGDLCNDGVHRVDFARRALEAGFSAQGKTLPEWPTAVSASGGKFFFDDAQEWPDTLLVTWDYPGALLTYEMRIWSKPPLEGESEGAAVYGENGYVVIGNSAWRAFDDKGRLVKSGSPPADDDVAHKRDMLRSIRVGGRPACDIATGHVTTSMVHMGNIAWRVNRKLQFDGAREEFVGDPEANAYLGRAYRAPWNLPSAG
jgi:predicted dehydrogenase